MWHALLSCFSPGDCRAEDVDGRTPWGGLSICELPADCLALIFHCGALNPSSLAAVRLVCKAWRVTLDASLPTLTLLLHSPCSREKEQRRFAVRKLQHGIATGSLDSPTSRCGMGSADDAALPTCSLGQHNSSWQAAALASQPHALQPHAPMLPYLRSFSHLTSLTVKPALNVTASCLEPSGNEAVAQLLLQPVVKRLHHLCLTELGLTQLPTAVTQLQVLRRLDLSRNPLGGWKGEGLLQLASTLTSLCCAGTCMERSPEGLHHLHQLRELVLADNGFGTCLEGLAAGQLPHLTSLDISRINLMALPPALACLTALTALKVSGNRMPELPQFISQLTQLRLLDIGFQYTRDHASFTLPQGLSALQHLKHLSVGCLGRTALASPALDSLQGLTSLECPANQLARPPPSLLQHSLLLSLDLASNGMHELPRTVRCLVHLRRLDLRTNQLKRLPSCISCLTALRTLYVSHNRLRELPEELSCLVSLTLLDASMNCLMLLPRHWERLKDLQCLMFNENKLLTLPASLGMLPSLTQLHLAGNSLVSLPSALGQLSCLSSLRLAHNALATADSCAALCAATSITCLSLEHNSLRELPPELGGMSSLRLLDVSCNQLLCLPPQLSALVALRHLYASRNRLRRLPSQLGDLPQLETLDVSWNRLTGLPSCLKNCPKIITINVCGNPMRHRPPAASLDHRGPTIPDCLPRPPPHQGYPAPPPCEGAPLAWGLQLTRHLGRQASPPASRQPGPGWWSRALAWLHVPTTKIAQRSRLGRYAAGKAAVASKAGQGRPGGCRGLAQVGV